MVVPGILRRVNKTLPALLQTIALIFFIHYVAQGVLTKIQRKYQQNYYTNTAAVSRYGHGGGAGRGGARPAGAGGGGGGHSSSRPSTTSTTTTTTTPVPALPDDVMEREQERRLDTLHKACARWGMGVWAGGEAGNMTEEERLALAAVPKSPLYQALLVSEEHKLAVCPAVRTGMQWLARRLLQLTGKFEEYQLHRLHEPPSAIARHNYPFLSSWEKYPTVLAQSLTILMGRHPLDRILASYRHILEDPEKNPHGYIHYGRRIVRSYRKERAHTKGPTFEEFVRFLLEHDSRYLDEAWQPIVRRCTPCLIPYNMVVHYETLWHDIQWAWKKAGIGQLNTTDYFVQQLTPQVRREYFSEVTISQVLALYKKYKLDFQVFGYTLHEHMAYATPGEEALDPALMAELPRQNQDDLQNLIREAQLKTPLINDKVNAKKDEEKETLGPPSESSVNFPLIGERGQPAELSNDLAALAEDYRMPPPQVRGSN